MALLDNTVLIYRFLIRSLGSKWDPCVFNDPLSGAALLFFLCVFSLFFPLLILISTMPLRGPSGWAEAGKPTAVRETQRSLLNVLQF